MLCPCGDTLIEREEHFPQCESCGYTQYDAWTLAIIAEAEYEQSVAKAVLGHVPTYSEVVEKGFCKP